MKPPRRASASTQEDRARTLVAAGFAVPGMLTLVTLPAIRALIPSGLDSPGDPEQRLFLLFFGVASLPFTLAAVGVAWLRPPQARGLRLVIWAAIALAAAGSAYAFLAR